MKSLITVCIMASICFAPIKGYSEDLQLTLATGEWQPYTSKEMTNYGLFTEIISAAFKEMGVTPQYRFYPWRRCFMSVKQGDIFGAFPYVITEKRKKDVFYSEPIISSNNLFFYRIDKFPQGIVYDRLEDLKTYRLGGVIGYFYEEMFKQENLTVSYFSTEEKMLRLLYHKRIDLMPLNEQVGWHLIRKQYPQEIGKFATISKPLSSKGLHLIVSKKYPDAEKLLKQFNAALHTVKNTPLYKSILNANTQITRED